jgi:glutathione S-transferase
MSRLFTMPGTCSLATNIAIAWLDAPVEIQNMAYGEHKKADYLAINPKGKVPALQFDDGEVLTEAAAILAYLGAKYGGERYSRDGRFGRKEAEALSYMTSEVHASYGPHFAAKVFADSQAAQEEVKRKAYERLVGHYDRMDQTLSDNGGTWYLRERSFADAFLYVLTRWLEQTPISINHYPALKQHRAHMEADDGVRVALRRQNMDPIE